MVGVEENLPSDKLAVIIGQIGAREHYQVAALCHANSALTRLHTDFWNPVPRALEPVMATLGGSSVRRLIGRCANIPRTLVRTHAARSAFWQVRLRLARDRAEAFHLYAAQGRDFARAVAGTLRSEDFTTFFGFSIASLEALEQAKELGGRTVLDEIAPTELEDEIIEQEQRRFPNWESSITPTPESFIRRMHAEWKCADRIIVNSAWTRDAIIRAGADVGKTHVIPISYCPLPASVSRVKSRAPGELLKVLWLGTLNLRKGLPYAIEGARILENAPVRFTFAGPIAVDLNQAEPLPRNARFIGQVPRVEAGRLWEDHHVFLLPTLSDGFAITQIEAMAHGLPVIATANCGSVVETGRSGLIIPPRDPEAIAKAVSAFLRNDLELRAASIAAIERADSFAPDAIWPQLCRVLQPNAET